ncbi:MAG: SdpI family protein [Tissierellia bacterium]|nr:SdpI family protein [Tissierellia bacterium]
MDGRYLGRWLWTSGVVLLPMVLGLLLWERLPQTMAIHFGWSQGADGFSGRAFAVFAIPLILLAFHLFLGLVTALELRGGEGGPAHSLVMWVMPAVSAFTAALVYSYNLGLEVSVGRWANWFLALVFLVLGRQLPNLTPNPVAGVRLPWTLASEENWRRTHVLAGRLFRVLGLLMVLSSLLPIHPLIPFSVALSLALLTPTGYSLFLHRRRGL